MKEKLITKGTMLDLFLKSSKITEIVLICEKCGSHAFHVRFTPYAGGILHIECSVASEDPDHEHSLFKIEL